MKINKKLCDFVLNRPTLLNTILKISNFENFPYLLNKRNEYLAHAIEGIYSAGETIESAENRIKELEKEGKGVILNYAMESASELGKIRMKNEYLKILASLKNHPASCVALKPTALISSEKILYLSELMKFHSYCDVNLDKIIEASEIEKIAEPFLNLSQKATELGNRILIDAEQSNLQPGVDLLAIYLMKIFNNSSKAYIYNTYQLYLKDSPLRLKVHKKWLENQNSLFAAKLVRGAYLSYESDLKQLTHPNYVICSSKKEVDSNFNLTVQELITEGRSNIIVATHNKESFEMVQSLLINDYNFDRVEFAYLMGFGDKISGRDPKLRCLEYVPYGPSDVKIPYLLRRLEENLSVFGNKGK